MKLAVDSINILVWIPILMIAIILALGWKDIRENFISGAVCGRINSSFFQYRRSFDIYLCVLSLSVLGLSGSVIADFKFMSLSKVATVVIILILVAVVLILCLPRQHSRRLELSPMRF